jgi:Mg-chelatase subunit ChlD
MMAVQAQHQQTKVALVTFFQRSATVRQRMTTSAMKVRPK